MSDFTLSKPALAILEDRYLKEGETPEDMWMRAARAYASDLEHSERLFKYFTSGWLSGSTPCLTNAPDRSSFKDFTRESYNDDDFSTKLPISCYLSYVEDTIPGILAHSYETRIFSVTGGATGGHWVDVRGTTSKSPGVIPWLKTHDSDVLAYHQGHTRRGSYNASLRIDHPDIEEFINFRKTEGGDDRRKCLNIHHTVVVPDTFMELISSLEDNPTADDSWDLVCPHSAKIIETVSARKLWQDIINNRVKRGEPFIFFDDTVNNALPQSQKDLGLKSHSSNLCLAQGTIINIRYNNEGVWNVIDVPIETISSFSDLYKNIEALSYNIKNNETEYKLIESSALTIKEAEVIEITDETGHTLACTPDHKVYTINRGYVEAKDLLGTDELLIKDRNDSKLSKIRKKKDKVDVYDLTISDNHNFYANNILVHNCMEITLPTSPERTSVCCLSSVNLKYFDDWKDNIQFIGDVVEYLDNVLEFYILNTEGRAGFEKARYSAMRERAIGIGTLGLHTYLQHKQIPIDSPMAIGINKKIFSHIKAEAAQASLRLGEERGESPDTVGTGMRNSHLLAIAPNASSGIIIGVSPSIEPYRANVFRQKTLSGSLQIVNPMLLEMLENKYYEKQKLEDESSEDWIEKVLLDIELHEGSIKHIDWIDDWDKHVFKTFSELDMRPLIDLAADRQQYICQSQSFNMYVPPSSGIKYIYHIHMRAWRKGLKTLYYLRSNKEVMGSTADISNKIDAEGGDFEVTDIQDTSCFSCE